MDIVQAYNANAKTLNKYLKENEFIVVHCNTIEKAVKLLTELKKLNYTWQSGNSIYNHKTYHHIYDNDMCYIIKTTPSLNIKSICYGSSKYCNDYYDLILEFDDLIL